MGCYVKMSLYNKKDAFWKCKIENRPKMGWEYSNIDSNLNLNGEVGIEINFKLEF